MDNSTGFFSYGEELTFEPGKVIYNEGEIVESKSVYYIKAGFVKVSYKLKNNSIFSHYLPSNTIFGIFDSISSNIRLSSAMSVEKSYIYAWDSKGFDLAAQISWELAETSLRSLTHNLRILNALYAERVGIL